MPFTAKAITLTMDERAELERMCLSRTLPAGDVFRARLILMLSEGTPYRTIQERLDTTAPTISRWRERFIEQRYMASDDPNFEEKAADIIGLYLHPPQHAAVFCVDERSAIQALDRLDPVLRCHPVGSNGMDSSIIATAHFRCMRLWTFELEEFRARLPRAIPAMSSSASWIKWLPVVCLTKKST